MSVRLNPVWRWLAAGLSVSAVCLVIVDQNTITRLRVEQQALHSEIAAAGGTRPVGTDLAKLRAENEEVKKLAQSNKDLPRLRNEIGRLRAGAAELEKLRAENQRLTAQQGNAAQAPAAAPLPADFIVRDALADVGLATPEAAIQTVFSAMTRGNFDRLVQCVADPKNGLDADPSKRQQMLEGMAQFPGFRFTGTKAQSATEAAVDIQTSDGGPVMKIRLVRVGNEWKLSDMNL